jgi:hypothetical protein
MGQLHAFVALRSVHNGKQAWWAPCPGGRRGEDKILTLQGFEL